MYGPAVILRLFVKLPEILGKMRIPPKTTKLLLSYFSSLLEFLSLDSNSEWFS